MIDFELSKVIGRERERERERCLFVLSLFYSVREYDAFDIVCRNCVQDA